MVVEGTPSFIEGPPMGAMSRVAFDALISLSKDINAKIEDSAREELLRLGYINQKGLVTYLGRLAVGNKKLLKKETKKSPLKRV